MMNDTVVIRPSGRAPILPFGLQTITICGVEFTRADFDSWDAEVRQSAADVVGGQSEPITEDSKMLRLEEDPGALAPLRPAQAVSVVALVGEISRREADDGQCQGALRSEPEIGDVV